VVKECSGIAAALMCKRTGVAGAVMVSRKGS